MTNTPRPQSTIRCFTEREAKEARRAHINSGHEVSLIGYNTQTDMYECDVY